VERLRVLLASIHQQCQGQAYRIVVVENDDSGSAEPVAAEFAANYIAEPTPGISAARNACLAQIRADDDFLVFVDDDEVVGTGWLGALLRAQVTYEADVVAGPVVTTFPAGTPRWIIKGGFMRRRRLPTGTELESVAAGNTLVATAAISRSKIRFDERFSFTGGEDTDFFRRLRPHISRAVWADDAVAFEEASPQRLRLSWIVRRSFRNGSVTARIQLRTRSRSWIVVHSLAAIGKNSLLFIGDSIKLRAPSAHRLHGVVANVGRVAEVFSVRSKPEYAR
jgi:glycosyltransferase involved in cell wall biosynthesis